MIRRCRALFFSSEEIGAERLNAVEKEQAIQMVHFMLKGERLES